MKEVILLKLGEVVLKGLNRAKFEKRLVDNIYQTVTDCGKYKLMNAQSTVYVIPEDGFNQEKALRKLKKIFGIVSVVIAGEFEKDIDYIKENAAEYLKDKLDGVKTFKCESRRSDKKFPLKSPEINAQMGAVILNAFPHLKVDVHNPDIVIYTEIRDYAAYVHAGRIKGAGGMPIGSNGKATLLLSGGIDSPVAGYMTAKRGVKIDAVHFASPPYTSERAKEKVVKLAKYIAEYTGPYKLYIVNFTMPQLEIYEKCPHEQLTIIMRRIMMQIAEKIAVKHKSTALITGESIGQVASQTLESLAVTDKAANIPVIRPLIAMDKDEIVEISRKINTFETSILPYEDCCTVFVPKHPDIKPILSRIEKSEENLDIEKLVNDSLENLEIIDIEP